jgi:hypothetical protein
VHLVQLLLPLYDNAGRDFPRAHFERVATELTARFGGLTAYTRAPAEGRWRDESDRSEGAPETARDEIIIYEVMTYPLDTGWWRDYRAELETLFAQDHIVVRAQAITLL